MEKVIEEWWKFGKTVLDACREVYDANRLDSEERRRASELWRAAVTRMAIWHWRRFGLKLVALKPFRDQNVGTEGALGSNCWHWTCMSDRGGIWTEIFQKHMECRIRMKEMWKMCEWGDVEIIWSFFRESDVVRRLGLGVRICGGKGRARPPNC